VTTIGCFIRLFFWIAGLHHARHLVGGAAGAGGDDDLNGLRWAANRRQARRARSIQRRPIEAASGSWRASLNKLRIECIMTPPV
jgi:hypothetical protein